MKRCSAVDLQMITRSYKMSLMELKEISFGYEAGEKPVLEQLSLHVDRGEGLWIKGENGSGKTTLFRVLNGLSFPQKGEYFFDGIKIDKTYLTENRNAKRFHKRIGYLFQNPDIMLFNGKVWDEIAFGPRQMGLSDEKVRERVTDCMRIFRITALADKAPYHLSGGQKKMVAFASVMALNPEVLILDEPFAYMDTRTQNWMADFLRELKMAGKTVILSSHTEKITEDLVDREMDLTRR